MGVLLPPSMLFLTLLCLLSDFTVLYLQRKLFPKPSNCMIAVQGNRDSGEGRRNRVRDGEYGGLAKKRGVRRQANEGIESEMGVDRKGLEAGKLRNCQRNQSVLVSGSSSTTFQNDGRGSQCFGRAGRFRELEVRILDDLWIAEGCGIVAKLSRAPERSHSL